MALTSKQRAQLRGLAAAEDTIIQVGKGGIVFAITSELNIPVKYVGVGEGIDDLIPFDAKTFAEALFK